MTPEEVRWVAHLARLELTEAELAIMTRQLTSIVDYVKQLQAVNTEGVKPLAHALPVHNVFRADEPRPVSCLSLTLWPTLPIAMATSTAFPRFWNEVVRNLDFGFRISDFGFYP